VPSLIRRQGRPSSSTILSLLRQGVLDIRSTELQLTAADDRLSYFHILPEPAHTILAHAGLSVLQAPPPPRRQN
jgi:hypothetical protein